MSEIEDLIHAGSLLSNIAFNLSQDKEIGAKHGATMRDCQRAWDYALRAYRNRIQAAQDAAQGRECIECLARSVMDDEMKATAAMRDVLKGRPIYLMGREHINDQRKPLAELKFGMVSDLGVLFCMADTEAPIPVDATPTTNSGEIGRKSVGDSAEDEVLEMLDEAIWLAMEYERQLHRGTDVDIRTAQKSASDAKQSLLRRLSRREG